MTFPYRQISIEVARASRTIAALLKRSSRVRKGRDGQAGAEERKVRTPQGSALVNSEGRRGISEQSERTPPVWKVPQKIYRPALRDKGEKVR